MNCQLRTKTLASHRPVLGTTGSVYWMDLTIPGMRSGGDHTCVAVSDPSYTKEHGLVVLAPMRRVPPCLGRMAIHDSDFIHFDRWVLKDRRIIDLTQLWSVSVSDLGHLVACLRPGRRTLLRHAASEVLQLGGPWQQPGRIVEVPDGRGRRSVVLLRRDDLREIAPDYAVCIEYRCGNPGWYFETVNTSLTNPTTRFLGRTQKQDLRRRIERMLGILTPDALTA